MLGQGASWSGHERNVCYLNLGRGEGGGVSFVDVSYVSGLDFEDDARAMVVTDQDGDGNLDLWLKNRTGPQLRFMRNRGFGSGAHWVALWLKGTTANRDAVGADVRVYAGGRVLRRFVAAGDGYLSQSSRWLHFGLAEADTVDRVVVRWPGGPAETFEGVAVDGRYSLTQGHGKALPVSPRKVVYAEPAPLLAQASVGRRVLLKTPLPLPPTLTTLIRPPEGEPRAVLLNLWAGWCEPCRTELAELAAAYPRLQAAGLDIVALSVDEPAQREAAADVFRTHVAPSMVAAGPEFGFASAEQPAREVLQAVLRHVLIRHEELTLPTSLLIDSRGTLQLIYLGATTPAALLEDLERFVTAPVQGARRSLYGGRWYFRSPRDLVGLAADLERRGLRDDARFYLALDGLARSTLED